MKVLAFGGVSALPLYAAMECGFFAPSVDPGFAANSGQVRDGLAYGDIQVAHAAVDNALALAEGGVDVSVVLGCDDGLISLVVRPDIQTLEDLRGRALVVDAPQTGFALLAYALLARHGLSRDVDFDVVPAGSSARRLEALRDDTHNGAALLTQPYAAQALAEGFRTLGDPLEGIGPYLANAAFVRRDWVDANSEVLTTYIESYLQGLEWACDPENRGDAAMLLQKHLQVDAALARDMAPVFARHAITGGKVEQAALDTVLSLRRTYLDRTGGTGMTATGLIDMRWRDAAALRLGE